MKDDPRPASAAGPDAPADAAGIGLDWQRAVLVCGDCEQRKDGPRHLGAKEVRRDLKHGLRGACPGGLRVVVTGCLGPCVKKALTVVAIGGSGMKAAPRAYALHDRDDLTAAVASLRRVDPR